MSATAELARAAYREVLSPGGVQAVLAGRADLGRYFTDDVVIVNFEEWPAVNGTFQGHEGVREWLHESLELAVEGGGIDLVEVLHESESDVVCRNALLGHARTSGIPVDFEFFSHWRARGGKLAFGKGFLREDEALAAVKPPGD